MLEGGAVAGLPIRQNLDVVRGVKSGPNPEADVSLPDPILVCDEPEEGAVVSRGMAVSGWAYSPAGIREVSVWLDGQKVVGRAELGLERPDVAQDHPEWPDVKRSGFRYRLDALSASELAEAAELTVVAEDEQGGRVEAHRVVQVDESLLDPILVCDEPEEGAVVSRGMAVSGWAYSPAGIREVSVWLEGQRLGEAELALEREDVGQDHPEWADAQRSGFRYRLEAAPWAGASAEAVELRVVAEDGEGRRVEVGRVLRRDRRQLLNQDRRQLTAEEIAVGEHRKFVGGMWDEVGSLQLEFLKEKGLLPHHRLVDIGCGSLRGGVRFVRYLDQGNYYGLDINASLIEAGKLELAQAGLTDKQPNLLVNDKFEVTRFMVTFDYAIAVSVFTHLYMNHIARCLAEVKKVLEPGGKLFATFFEAPSPVHLEPIRHEPEDLVTEFDANPFHYSFSEIQWLSESAGLEVRYLGDWGHPRDQQMLCFSLR
jgi:SAM-dependent methyltransferase